MTTSGKRFIKNQTKRPVLELSTGTDKEPKPIKITASEAQTISDAVKKPQIQSSAIQNIRQQTEPATISPAERYQTSQANRELETYQEDMQTLRNQNALSSAGRTIGDLQLSAQVAFDTMGTSNLEAERERATQQFEKTRVKTLSYAKPILDKDEATQGLIEAAKTGKTNMFEAARKDAAEFGAGSAINTTFPNQWVSDNGDTVYFMNSKSTVTKPTLKNTLKFENSRIQDAYNGITYNFAQNGQMYTVQEIKDYYTEWQNVPDDVVQQFIYDACHDVQTGERRNIDLYAEYYPALSNGDKYVNQKDSLLQLLADDNFIEYGLGEYLAGKTATGEDIDPTKTLQGTLGGEDITKILQAALTLTEAADELNEVGANITQATDYAIAKTYADQFPTIKEALDTFDRINISNEDFQKLVDNYNNNIGNIRQQFRYYGGDKGLSLTEYRKKVDDLVQENMREFNEEFINSWNKERIQGSLDYAESNIILDFFMGNAYRANDGKWYDRNGNEVERNDVNIGLANKYLETFRSFTRHATELEYDTAFAAQDPSRESVINILSDSVGMAFDVFMMGKGGIELQTKFEIPYIGSIYQLGMDATMDQAGEMVLNLANLTLFYDGERTPESQEKFKEAAGGFVFMLGMKEVAKTKGLIRESIKDDIYRSALRKSIKSYTDTLAKGLREIDVEGDQAKILQQQQPEPKPGENAKAEKQIESERTNQKIMFIRNILEKAKKEFNKTFQEELSKGKGDRSIVDTLWNAAINLRQSEKATADTESRITREQERKTELEQRERDIDNEIINAKGEGNTDLVEQLRKQKQEIKDQIADIDGKIERLTEGRTTLKDKTDEIVESVREAYGETVEGFREWGEEITTPEVRVEETTTEAPKPVEGTAEVKEPQGAKETKTTIAKILDIIQNIQDNAKELINETRKKIEQRKADKEIERNKRYFLEKDFEEGDVRVMQDNANSDILLRLIDKLTTNRDKKGKEIDENLSEKEKEKKTVQITKKGEIEGEKVTKDLIEREILSEGLIRIKKYTDRLNQFRKMIGNLYDKLSKTHNIDSSEFATSEPLTNLLNNYGLKLEVRYDENGRPFKADVSRADGQKLLGKSKDIAGYVEHFLNEVLNFDILSEYELYDSRSELKWNKNTYQNYDAGFENSMRNAFNEFIDGRPETEMLRTLDKAYSELKDNLDVLSDLFKQGELKDNAKNKILNRDKETLDQMNKVLPGIKDLVELAKFGPSIVKRGIDAKTTYKKTHKLLGSTARLLLIGGGLAIKGTMGFVAGSVIRATAEALAVRGKRKIQGKKPDRETWNKMYDTLKVEGNTKAKLKQDTLKRYEELSDQFRGETEKRINEIIQGAIQKITERRADEIMEEKRLQDEMNLENWNRSQQPINNALPGIKPDIATAEGEITLGIGNPINPETLGSKGVKPQPKPIKEVKETYKDKEKTQQGYTMGEQLIIEAAIGGEKEASDPKVEKVADILEAQIKQTADVVRESAINSLEEKGETITEENIAKEIQKEPSSIEEFIMEAEKGAPEKTTNYDGADIKDLEEVVSNPKKYPNVDIEAAKSALEKARRQNIEAEIMQSPDQKQAQKEIAGIYKGNQMEREGNKGREKQREDMVRETNRDFDTLETTEEYDRIESQITPEKGEQAKKYAKGYKGFYRSDKAKTDTLRADMGKKASQNITYTSSVDKIATLENPKTRARVAQERLNKRKRLSEEEKTQLNQIIEQANVEIQAKEELKAQKTELANEYKALDKKRSETPYRETKKEITKQMDKISDEFDKLTYEEQGQFAKPKEVEAEEIKEAERIEEERQNLDMNETPQIDEKPQEVSSEKVVEGEKEAKTDKLSMDDLKGDAPIETKNKVTDILNDTTDNIVENIQKGKSVKETSDKNIYGQEVPKDIKDRAGEGVLKNNKGELVPIFHGSNSKFTIEEFDENRAVSGLGGTNGGFGMFFAIRYEYAEGAGKFITDRKKGETNVMECYSNIKNPILHPQYIVEKLSYDPVTADTLLMDYYRKVGRMDYLDEIHDFAESEGYESLVDALGDKLLMEGDQWRNAEFRGDTVKEKQILQKLGYDSIIFSEENFTIAIFDPKKNVKQVNQETGKNKGGDKPEEPTTPKKPEPNKPTGGTPLVDVAKDGTVNKEPGLGDYTTDQIQKRIDELKKKRQDNGKKLYAQDLSELRVLQDLLKRQIERENREEGSTELTDRQREILNSNNYGDEYRAGGAGTSED